MVLTDKGGFVFSGSGLVEDAPALFTSLDAVKGYENGGGNEEATSVVQLAWRKS